MAPPKPRTHGFPKAAHLRRRSEFDRVFVKRRSLSNSFLLVYGCLNDCGFVRVGLSVSRKYGNAVKRNRLRRLYREAFRLVRHELPFGVDVVFIPRSSQEPSLADLKKGIKHLVITLASKLGIK